LRYPASFYDRYRCRWKINCEARFFGSEFGISSPLCGVRPGFFDVVVEVGETKQGGCCGGLVGLIWLVLYITEMILGNVAFCKAVLSWFDCYVVF
jgi:hypothetical protein